MRGRIRDGGIKIGLEYEEGLYRTLEPIIWGPPPRASAARPLARRPARHCDIIVMSS